MTHLTRRAGTTCLRWLVLPATVTALTIVSARAQDAPKGDERNQFDKYRSGAETRFGPESKALFDKYCKWYAAQINHSDTQRPGAQKGMSAVVEDFAKRTLLLPSGIYPNSPFATTHYSKLKPEQKQFIDEFGKSAVEVIGASALQAGNPIIRINAARMIAEVCRNGYDGAAEVCLKILAKPDESDAVKFYALQGLKNLFSIVPDPVVAPEKTVFQKQNTAELRPLEQRCIQALLDYIFRQPSLKTVDGDAPVNPAAQPDPDAIFYVRREAVRALALVRVQQVKNKGQVVSRPALALLKVARGDGLNPPSVTPQGTDVRAVGERIEAVIGFCNLYPARDRQMNTDYAVYQVGRAMQDIPTLYQPNANVTSTPWVVSVKRLRDALTNWHTRALDMKVDNAKLIKDLIDAVDRDILLPIESAQAANLPNAAAFGQWLQQLGAKSKSLFNNDDKTVVSGP